MVGIISKYSDFFREQPPTDKFDLISHIPRAEILCLISAVNDIIKSPVSTSFNDSLESQYEIIDLIFRNREDNKECRYAEIAKKCVIDFQDKIRSEGGGGVLLFTRFTCLYTINEIIKSDKFLHESRVGQKYTREDFLSVFKFILLCNTEWLGFSNIYEEEVTFKKFPEKFFEIHMFLEIPYQQYYFLQNPINLLFRAIEFFDYIKKEYQEQLNHFLSGYQLKSPHDFIAVLTKFYFSKGVTKEFQAFVVNRADSEMITRLNKLSFSQKEVDLDNERPNEFLFIRKRPIYRFEQEETISYIVLDNTFFLEKCYDLFFWEFYFESLKGEGINLKYWGGYIGKFFESYIDRIFQYSLANRTDFVYREPQQLNLGDKEFVDYYLRRARRVILIQAKRSYLPYNDYKEVSDLSDYERLDKEKFYARFGLYQLLNSIEQFFELAPIIDNNLPKNRIFIYPVLVVNEPIVATPLTIFAFRTTFNRLLEDRGLLKDKRKLILKKLIIIHVSELERIQQSLHDGDIRLDSFFQDYINSTDMHHSKNFYAEFKTFDQFIRYMLSNKAIPQYIHDREGKLFSLMSNFLE